MQNTCKEKRKQEKKVNFFKSNPQILDAKMCAYWSQQKQTNKK